ncbi:MAG: hypothetical protein A2284_12225 [Deltaproteobacteria bacterium RIFOXYA12_FULL_61_11]|nr:MAG: hypothetical protein A2284_12225 [Deltaproteobacteria bacterium RIFOXYA12_FULL_61_11]
MIVLTRSFYLLCVGLSVILTLPQVRAWLFLQGLRWLMIGLFSFVLAVTLMPPMIWLSHRFRILDRPHGRKQHGKPTPLLGGVALFLAVLIPLLLNFILTEKLVVFLSAASGLLLVSLFDDCRPLPALPKLMVQLACAAAVVLSGVVIKLLPVDLPMLAPIWQWSFHFGNVVLTFVWIVGIINAINFLDGMDGLGAGLGALISFLVGVVSFQNAQPLLGWICIGMMGACLGFLPFNFRLRREAAIFLGDTGSTFIGFTLAYIAIEGNWSNDRPWVALIAPLLVFGIPIYDMTHITVMRIASGSVRTIGEWLSYAGRDHIHHRFEALLGSKKKSVLFILLLNACLGVNAVLLRGTTLVESLLLWFQFLGFLVIVTILEHAGNQLGKKGERRAGGSVEEVS